jgi:hypothetical protein
MVRLAILFLFVSMLLGAITATDASSSSERPMLWETTTHMIFDKVVDPEKSKWTSSAGPPQTLQLCLLPFRPKAGEVPNANINCWFSKVADRGERISRIRICTNEFGVRSKTKITGIETENYFALKLDTDMRDQNGKLLKELILLEAGRMLGECPPDMKVHKPFSD